MSNDESTPALSLAEQINRAHSLVLYGAKTQVERAITCGELLIEAKEKEAAPGKWIEWLTANCPGIPERTAQRYMLLAREKPPILKWAAEQPANLADLNLGGAEWIAHDAEKAEGQQTTQSTTRPGFTLDKESTRYRLKAYSKAEEKLIEKLGRLSPDAARSNADRTIAAIQDTVSDLEAKEEAKPKAA
jgi:hypothetical protein